MSNEGVGSCILFGGMFARTLLVPNVYNSELDVRYTDMPPTSHFGRK